VTASSATNPSLVLLLLLPQIVDGVVSDSFIRNWLDLLSFLLSGLPANGTIAAEVAFMVRTPQNKSMRHYLLHTNSMLHMPVIVVAAVHMLCAIAMAAATSFYTCCISPGRTSWLAWWHTRQQPNFQRSLQAY
jgi:hypothetical protein